MTMAHRKLQPIALLSCLCMAVNPAALLVAALLTLTLTPGDAVITAALPVLSSHLPRFVRPYYLGRRPCKS